MSWIDTCFWYLNNIWLYARQMIPCMLVAVLLFVFVLPLRRRILVRRGLNSNTSREVMLLVFTMFMAGLAALTLFPEAIWTHFIDSAKTGFSGISAFSWADHYPPFGESLVRLRNLKDLIKPLEEIRRAFRAGPWLMFMLLGNIGIFIPIGLLSSLLWRKPSWWRAVCIGFICSTGIEFVQLFVGRRTDVDDVMLNTLGALLGYILFWVLKLLFPALTAKFHCQTARRNTNG